MTGDEYFKAFGRMCKAYPYCLGCPLHAPLDDDYPERLSCNDHRVLHSPASEHVVQQWVLDHPEEGAQ
jgi:hypothetical protein